MYWFECIVKTGHQGAGKYGEKAFRLKADNIMQAMRRAKNLPGVKKGLQRFSGASVMSVQMVR